MLEFVTPLRSLELHHSGMLVNNLDATYEEKRYMPSQVLLELLRVRGAMLPRAGPWSH